MRRAACTLKSAQFFEVPAAGSLAVEPVAGAAGVGADEVLPQPASRQAITPNASQRARAPRVNDFMSVQCTIDFLCQILGDAVHAGEVFDARVAHATSPSEALQKFRTLLGTDARDVFEH